PQPAEGIRGEADAVVGDPKNDGPTCTPHRHIHAGGLGMTGDVGKSLLDDPEGVALESSGEAREFVGVQLHGDPGPLRGLLHQVLDGGLESEVAKDAGPQLARNAANDLHGLVDAGGDGLADHANLPGWAGALGRLRSDPCQVELQGGEGLAQLIVNLAGDPGPLLLANRLEPGSEGPQLGAGLFELLGRLGAVGDVALNAEM